MAEIHHRCPDCGDRDHLYGRADVRWSHHAQAWECGDMEDEIECTECDWAGSLAETVYQEPVETVRNSCRGRAEFVQAARDEILNAAIATGRLVIVKG